MQSHISLRDNGNDSEGANLAILVELIFEIIEKMFVMKHL